MKQGKSHLTYCLNIHPGESWTEVFSAIREHAVAVRDMVAPGERFGLGLRLSAQAAAELAGSRQKLAECKRFLRANNLYVFTVNAFPYGQFHAAPVKEDVYAPDWRSPQRLGYTLDVARILAALLPRGIIGSISTVPGSWSGWVKGAGEWRDILLHLSHAVLELANLERATGKRIVLALEPEPDCLLQDTDDLLRFWALLRGPGVLPKFARACGVRTVELRHAIQRHLGVCLDTCHFAVQFELPAMAFARLLDAKIPVVKVQISAAPAVSFDGTPVENAAVLEQLSALAEPVYLHQTRVRHKDGRLVRFSDLAPALADVKTHDVCELRTHFHIPLTIAQWGRIGTTRELLGSSFFNLLASGAAPHIELETYSFQALPEELRRDGVDASLAGEFRWFLNRAARAVPQSQDDILAE